MNIVLVVEMIRETEEAGHSFYLLAACCCVSCVADLLVVVLLLVSACYLFAVESIRWYLST
jgi:hypothetical protein